jgi:ERCC4-type nuclease
MKLIIDSREQAPLTFSPCVGVEYEVSALGVGDYSASYTIEGKEGESHAVVERKSLGDLFSSYTSGYERERAKFLRCKDLGKCFILAIEGTASDILRGHTYTKGGVEHRSKKDGMTMFRQIMSCANKYGIIPWFCESRAVMALMIQEYFLAEERMLRKKAEENHAKVQKTKLGDSVDGGRVVEQ